MTPAERFRERELSTWRKKLELASLPPLEGDMVFRWSGPATAWSGPARTVDLATLNAARLAIQGPVSYLPPGARASWRRGTWA